MKTKKVKFALRQKQDTYIRSSAGDFKLLSQLGLTPGTKLFYTGVTYTKKKGFGTFCLAAYWRRKYRGHVPTEGWYILTNLATLEEVIEVYQSRSGIEALFKDCKSGGYNLEGSKASTKRVHPNFAKIPGCAHQELISENDNQGSLRLVNSSAKASSL